MIYVLKLDIKLTVTKLKQIRHGLYLVLITRQKELLIIEEWQPNWCKIILKTKNLFFLIMILFITLDVNSILIRKIKEISKLK